MEQIEYQQLERWLSAAYDLITDTKLSAADQKIKADLEQLLARVVVEKWRVVKKSESQTSK